MKIIRFWSSWSYEKLEHWLEELASEGYFLNQITGFGTIYHFTQTEPRKIRYCIEYISALTPDYEQLLIDDHWQTLHAGFEWVICYKAYEDERPSLYTDYDLLIAKNKKYMYGLLTTVFVLLLVIYKELTEFYTPKYSPGIILVVTGIILFISFFVFKMFRFNRSVMNRKKMSHK